VLGHLLARAHISYVILERLEADGLRARTKAGLIEQHTVELLAPYGLAEPIVEHGTRNGVCEFRADGEAFVLDYGALTDSPGHFIYPQHELVAEWAEQLLATGGEIRFGTQAVAVAQDGDGTVVSAVVEGTGEELEITFTASIRAASPGRCGVRRR
jgi:p-hydroxybenzoate 3-monooxygenase